MDTQVTLPFPYFSSGYINNFDHVTYITFIALYQHLDPEWSRKQQWIRTREAHIRLVVQVWYLIVSIPDLYTLTYFVFIKCYQYIVK